VLGLEEVPKPPVLAARGGFWLALADGRQVHVAAEEGERSKRAHVAYEVDDLAGFRARLTAAGIDVKDGEPIPGYVRFELRDPFGNRVELLQRV
jgi:catechol 2,3-dioxygenase-like lactoylglutathione lyase family enzyme